AETNVRDENKEITRKWDLSDLEDYTNITKKQKETPFTFEVESEDKGIQKVQHQDQMSKRPATTSNPHAKRKKMLVGGVASLVLFVSVIGGGIYAWGNGELSEVGASEQKVEVKEEIPKLQFTFEDQSFELDLSQIGYQKDHPHQLDQEKMRAWLDEVKAKIDKPVKNADVEKLGQTIENEEIGRVVDVDEVEKWLTDIPSLINQPREIPIINIEPDVRSSDLERVDEALIGKYKTTFSGSKKNRTHNIRLASERINQLILMPGEKFSFNEVVGERTAARGYKSAGIIIRGEPAEGLGGGICQVSTTLYNAVDRAGIKTVRRFSHSAAVPYVPPGRDATVSWGGPDYRFKNNMDKPIMIKVKLENNAITIYMYTVPGAKKQQKNAGETESKKTFSQQKSVKTEE
ncbi:VanW family protein, partial [Polycladospora coralii]|uniref:VanW family protein n=1 Tax=Polycladospora coralii TaxID=2771432 RepID=UPI001CD12767